MFEMHLFIIISLFWSVSSEHFLSDPVKVFHFRKDTYGSGEFNYRYKQDNGEIFLGRTFIMSKTEKNPYRMRATNGSFYNVEKHVFLMSGASRTFYWGDFTDNDLQKPGPFPKYVRSVELNPSEADVLAYFKDNTKEYRIFKDGSMAYGYYPVQWNVGNVCFRKSPEDPKRFFYTISSTNNAERYDGTIIIDQVDQYTRVKHFDYNGLYKVKFSRNEFNSMSFCKSLERVPHEELVYGEHMYYISDPDYEVVYSKYGINPNLFRALIKH